MKVIFLTSVPPYRAGQVAEVATGYALNYLVPKQLAKVATPEALDQAKRQHAAEEQVQAHDMQAREQLVALLQGATVKVTAKAAPKGKLYAALAPERLAAAVAETLHCTLPADLVDQLPALKHTGTHPMTLNISGKQVTFTIVV